MAFVARSGISIAAPPQFAPRRAEVNGIHGLKYLSFSAQRKSFPSIHLLQANTRFRVSCAAKPETVTKVCEIVKKQLALSDDSPVTGESKFSALGADSLDTKLCEVNSISAKKVKMAHTSGRKSYARKRKELEIALGKEPDQLAFWEVTHKKKDGNFVNKDAEDSMEASGSQSEEVERLKGELERMNDKFDDAVREMREEMRREMDRLRTSLLSNTQGAGGNINPIDVFSPNHHQSSNASHELTSEGNRRTI